MPNHTFGGLSAPSKSTLALLHRTQGGHQSRHHLLPSFFNQGRSLQLIHHRQRHPAVAADARTAVEQRRHHPISNIAKYESAASHLLAPTNLGLGDVSATSITSSWQLRIARTRASVLQRGGSGLPSKTLFPALNYCQIGQINVTAAAALDSKAG